MRLRFRSRLIALVLLGLSAGGCAVTAPEVPSSTAKQQVADTERAFAKTMADRDLNAFTTFLAEDTVFFSGPTPLHGPKAVTDFWAKFYSSPAAPFEWTPEEVEVLSSGKLALSSGPVRNPQGKLIGRFTSIWRLESDGKWRVVFDKGSEVCDCKQ